MKLRMSVAVIIVASVCIAAMAGESDTQSPMRQINAESFVVSGASYHLRGQTRDGWAWTKMPWTSDDSKYAKVRATIDDRITRGEDPLRVVQGYKSEADKHPLDPLAEFSYGYTTWRIMNDPTLPLTRTLFGGEDIPDRLAEAPFPDTYNYARLRFLVEMRVRFMPQLIQVGERLVDLQPTDRSVRSLYAGALLDTRTASNINLASENLDTLMAQDPKSPSPYFLRGTMLQEKYHVSHDPSEAAAAISDFQTYLRLIPSNYTTRPLAQHMIMAVQSDMKSVNSTKH